MKWLKSFNFFVESIKLEESSEDFIDVSILDDKGNKIGSFQLESYDGKNYTIIDAFIDEEHRNLGYYKKSILDLLNERPDITIISVFRSEEASRAWDKLVKNLPSDVQYSKKFHKGENTLEYKLIKVTDGTFMYDPSCEEVLPIYIKVIKGDPKNPQRLAYKKGIVRHLGPQIQIPYETMDKNGGRENPDTLEFDIYWDYNTNHKSLSINVEVNYGDLTACQFSIEAPNKVDVIRYTSYHSKDDTSNTVFALDDESLQAFCNYINRWDHGIHINREDLKFMDKYDNYLPT